MFWKSNKEGQGRFFDIGGSAVRRVYKWGVKRRKEYGRKYGRKL